MKGFDSPVFIAGLAKSGKTQVRRVIGAHPELSFTRRTYLWTDFYECFGDLDDEANLADLISRLSATDGVRALDPDWARIRSDFRTGAPTYVRFFALIHSQHASARGRRRWGEQLGGVELRAPEILAEIPDARFIHMIRHPLARPPGRRGVNLIGDTSRWNRSVESAVGNAAQFDGRYLTVKYESLVSDPEGTLALLCEFIEEDIHPAMRETIRHVDLAESRANPVPPEMIDPHTRSLMARFGYQELEAPGPVSRRVAGAMARALRLVGHSTSGNQR